MIQTITPIPRLNTVNAVCLLSTNGKISCVSQVLQFLHVYDFGNIKISDSLSLAANLAPNSSSPAVAVASKQGTTGLIMSPSMTTGNSGLPITKVIPVGRDGSASIVDSLFAQSNNPSTSNAVTVSAVSVSGTQVSSGHNISSTNVILPSPGSGQGIVTNASGSTQSQSHHLVHVQGPINVHHANAATATLGVGIPPSNLAAGNLGPSYFVEKNGNLSLLQPHQSRPMSLEKRTSDGKNIPTGSMIFTTQQPHLQSGNSGQTATVTIPIAHGGQQVSFAHPITMSHSGPHQVQGSAQIITTPISAHVHHISTTVLGTMSTPTISVSAPTSLAQLGHAASQSGPLHAIPTHVISSQPAISISSSSASNSLLTNSSISTTVASISVTVANTCAISCNPVSVSVNLTSSAATTTTSSTSTACTTVSTGSSLSTSAPAQSPNTKSTTHSPRPSILRKQREVSDNHIPARAQRNLTLQLNFAGNTTNSSSNPTIPPSASASAAAVAASANKENAGAMERGPPPIINNSCNNNNNSSTGLSILRKEFQPPNEESSWQSCSSHSSGSTTISATSETAEYQMNQPSSNSNMEAPTTLNCESIPSSSTFSGNASSPISQNGVVRPVTSSSQGRGAHKNSSKLQNKDIERLKRDKEDHVSPRKKPRKQQL